MMKDAYKGQYEDRYSLEEIKFSIGDFTFEEMIAGQKKWIN